MRRFEEKCAEMYGRAKIGGFLHLYIGEEAVAAGAIPPLKPQDYIVTHYRDHGHAIARGLNTKALMAELFGRVTGTSKGKGGSMHLFDASKGFLGGYAIVGGMMPIATGLAMSAKYKGEDRVCLCIFGDGAVNEGEFHESFNIASLYKLPVLFLLENNGFGMGTRVERVHSGGTSIARLGEAYKIPAEQIDGMDVLSVREAAMRAIDHCRSGNGPYFLEAICYRFRGHSMADPVQYRAKEEEEMWRARDPITPFRQVLEGEGFTKGDFEDIAKSVEQEMDEAVQFADSSPNPPVEELYNDIYK
jgi:pyruvate dehydrogenase E1 component alpha subunit